MINLFTDMFISMKPAELQCAVQPLDLLRFLGNLFIPDQDQLTYF